MTGTRLWDILCWFFHQLSGCSWNVGEIPFCPHFPWVVTGVAAWQLQAAVWGSSWGIHTLPFLGWSPPMRSWKKVGVCHFTVVNGEATLYPRAGHSCGFIDLCAWGLVFGENGHNYSIWTVSNIQSPHENIGSIALLSRKRDLNLEDPTWNQSPSLTSYGIFSELWPTSENNNNKVFAKSYCGDSMKQSRQKHWQDMSKFHFNSVPIPLLSSAFPSSPLLFSFFFLLDSKYSF